MSIHSRIAGAALTLFLGAQSAFALGADVTPGIIFGSGNANGGFKVETLGPLELGLRTKLRYNTAGDPENTFPFDGADTYTFDPADGNAPAGLAIWNFEWSIFTGLGGGNVGLSEYAFDLMVEGPNGNTASINPTSVFLASLAPSGIFTKKTTAQGSQNVGFDLDLFGSAWPIPAATSTGTFTITLTASQGGSEVLSNSINVNVIPVPAALPLMGGVLALFGMVRWRKRHSAA